MEPDLRGLCGSQGGSGGGSVPGKAWIHPLLCRHRLDVTSLPGSALATAARGGCDSGATLGTQPCPGGDLPHQRGDTGLPPAPSLPRRGPRSTGTGWVLQAGRGPQLGTQLCNLQPRRFEGQLPRSLLGGVLVLAGGYCGALLRLCVRNGA